jgi:hypothetical protein
MIQELKSCKKFMEQSMLHAEIMWQTNRKTAMINIMRQELLFVHTEVPVESRLERWP